MNIGNNNYTALTFDWNRSTTPSIARPLDIRRHTQRATFLRFIGALVLCSMLLAPTQSYAELPRTQVQGRLIGQGFYGPTPIPGLVVTLCNQQFGRSGRAVSRPDGTFYFGSVPLGAYVVEVWFRNSPHPRTFWVIVNRMPFANIGTFQLDMPMGVQSTQSARGGSVYGD